MEEWDDAGDSQKYVDRQESMDHAGYHSPCSNHDKEESEDYREEYRMWVIMRNGNSGEHYFDYFNNHKSSADIYDDEEEQDVE